MAPGTPGYTGNGADPSPADYFYHADDLGNIMAVTDAAGVVIERYAYNDYGQPTIFDNSGNALTASAIGNPYLFNGRRFDAETGLYDYRTRYLDPATGRFISRDTIGIWGDPLNLGNGYAYVGNNPWTLVDPWGLFGWGDAWRFTKGFATGVKNVAVGTLDAAGNAFQGAVNYGYAVATGNETMADNTLRGVGHRIVSAEEGVKTTYGNFRKDGYGAYAAAGQTMMSVGASSLGGDGFLNGYEAARKGNWEEAGAGMAEGAMQAGGAVAGTAGTLGKLKGFANTRCLSPRVCFVGGTLVHTEGGLKAIEQVEAGERVWACDPSTGEWRLNEAKALLVHDYAGDLVSIQIGEEIVRATGNHPFWVTQGAGLAGRPPADHVYDHERSWTARGRWVNARDLRVGDILLTRAGQPGKVTSLSSCSDRVRVYNLAVDGLHTYAVGQDGALVHNKPMQHKPVGPNRPPNLSPPGAGHRGALRQALRDNGVPTSKQPDRVVPNIDRRGHVQPGRVYEYDVPVPGGGTRTVRIRDDARGHDYGPEDPQNRGPHFNDDNGGHYDY